MTLLGLAPWESYLSVPTGTSPKPLVIVAHLKALWPILDGALQAISLGRWRHGPGRASLEEILVKMVSVRRPAIAVGGLIGLADGALRQWSAAAMSVLPAAIVFGAAMLVGH
jgi:hypothetical protein